MRIYTITINDGQERVEETPAWNHRISPTAVELLDDQYKVVKHYELSELVHFDYAERLSGR